MRGVLATSVLCVAVAIAACEEAPPPATVTPQPYVAPKHAPGPMDGVRATRMTERFARIGLDIRNLPPIEQLTPGQRQAVMRTFTETLGVPCLGCHAEERFDADTRRKRIAKRMYNEIVRVLALRDGEPVYCDSCHDGDMFMLDRRDTAKVTHHMNAVLVGQMTRIDGRPHDCTSCHGDPPDFKMLTTWKLTTAPNVVGAGAPAAATLVTPHAPELGPRHPEDCGPNSEKCPLQGLMVDEIANAVVSKDRARLGAALDRIAALSPEPSWTWSTIARDGAAAARAGDSPKAMQSCASCHALYKAAWRDRHRTTALP